MNIHYRKVEPDPTVEALITDHLERFRKFLLKSRGGNEEPHLDASISEERGRVLASVTLRSKGGHVTGSGRGHSAVESVTEALHKIRIQLQKRKEKVQDHHREKDAETA
ncbi:MAG: HPF/RaiA family ribosome-associated protein [Nitrospirae bacterium]|nr:HPF/RaiA family ribosome-associated protein [Nitrospirota bacterium]